MVNLGFKELSKIGIGEEEEGDKGRNKKMKCRPTLQNKEDNGIKKQHVRETNENIY